MRTPVEKAFNFLYNNVRVHNIIILLCKERTTSVTSLIIIKTLWVILSGFYFMGIFDRLQGVAVK